MAIAKVAQILMLLRREGWSIERQVGSHRQFRHATKKGTVTVNGHESDTLSHYLVRSILKQAGLTKEDLSK
jgi:predicted RNA binding protein YcfA (HicA-like mRNA interferase family)